MKTVSTFLICSLLWISSAWATIPLKTFVLFQEFCFEQADANIWKTHLENNNMEGVKELFANRNSSCYQLQPYTSAGVPTEIKSTFISNLNGLDTPRDLYLLELKWKYQDNPTSIFVIVNQYNMDKISENVTKEISDFPSLANAMRFKNPFLRANKTDVLLLE